MTPSGRGVELHPYSPGILWFLGVFFLNLCQAKPCSHTYQIWTSSLRALLLVSSTLSQGYVKRKDSTVNFVPVESNEAAQQTSFKEQNALTSNCFELKESISMKSAFQLQRISLKAQPCLPLLRLFDVVFELCGHEGNQITEEPLHLRSVELAAVTLCLTYRRTGERSGCCLWRLWPITLVRGNRAI